MFDDCRHTRLGRKDHYILLAGAGAILALVLLVYDLVQQVLASPQNTTSQVTVLILTVQCLCCLASFLGYVYRSLAGRPGVLTHLSLIAVFSNLGLLLLRIVHEILFAGYRPEDYNSDNVVFEDVFFEAK